MFKYAILFVALLGVAAQAQELALDVADHVAHDLLDDAIHRVVDDVACHAQGGHYMGRDYYFETSKKRDRDESESFCQSLGMHLVAVNDCRQNTFIVRFIRAMRCEYENFWIDGYQNGDRNWYLTSTGGPLRFTNWMVGEPNYKVHGECIHIRKDHLQWNDERCSDKYYAVCSTK